MPWNLSKAFTIGIAYTAANVLYRVAMRFAKQMSGRKEMFCLTTHSTHLYYGYMASNIWERTSQLAKEETRCRHMGCSFRLAARVIYMHHPTDRITHTTAFVTPVVEHWLILYNCIPVLLKGRVHPYLQQKKHTKQTHCSLSYSSTKHCY